MQEGLIIRGYSGFYYVQVNNQIYECSLRGRYRIKNQDFLPGDRVEINIINDNKGVIEKVLPRTVELVRPPIANVTKVIIVAAAINPSPDLVLVDRLLVMAAKNNLIAELVFNKCDLVDEKIANEYKAIYEKAGYKVLLTSTKKNIGIEELKLTLKDHINVFAGLSGVGKSSLLNSVYPEYKLKTGEVSEKNRKGRHTTRHVSLLPLPTGGLVADTPGFSRLYLPEMKREELMDYFPDLLEYKGECRFNSCLHKTEPDCAIKAAVLNDEIQKIRYEHYLIFLDEVIANERSY